MLENTHLSFQSFPAATAEETESAIAQAKSTIGAHCVLECELKLPGLPTSIDELLRMFPALRYAERLSIDGLNGDAADLLSILRKFENLHQFILDGVPMRFSWTLLRLPVFLRLDYLSIFMDDAADRNPFDQQLMENELAFYCSQIVDYNRSARRTIFVGDWKLSSRFVERILAIVSEKTTTLSVAFYSDEPPALSEDEFDISFVDGESPSWDYCAIYTSKNRRVRVLVQEYDSFSRPRRLFYRIAVTNDPTPKFYYDVLKVGRGLGG